MKKDFFLSASTCFLCYFEEVWVILVSVTVYAKSKQTFGTKLFIMAEKLVRGTAGEEKKIFTLPNSSLRNEHYLQTKQCTLNIKKP